MPVLAKSIGIGVGSLYRQFPTKDDLLTDLVLERIVRTRKIWETAAERPDAWPAIREAVLETVAQSHDDYLSRDMLTLKMNNERLGDASKPILAILEQMLDRARAEGAIRGDASVSDIRLIFRAIYDANEIAPDGATRLALLALDGLERGHERDCENAEQVEVVADGNRRPQMAPRN